MGSDDVVVMVSVQLQTQNKEKGYLEVLPGIPKEDRIGEKTLSESLSMVKKITATILIDKSISEGDEAIIKKLASGLLGVSPESKYRTYGF